MCALQFDRYPDVLNIACTCYYKDLYMAQWFVLEILLMSTFHPQMHENNGPCNGYIHFLGIIGEFVNGIIVGKNTRITLTYG